MVKIINANQTVNSVVATNAHSLTTLDRCIHLLVWPESYEYPSSSLLYSSWAYNFWDSAHSYYLSMLQERPPTVRLNKRCGFASLQQLSSCMSQRVSLSTLYIKPHVILPVICKARVWILGKTVGSCPTMHATRGIDGKPFLEVVSRTGGEARSVDARPKREGVGDKVWQRTLAGPVSFSRLLRRATLKSAVEEAKIQTHHVDTGSAHNRAKFVVSSADQASTVCVNTMQITRRREVVEFYNFFSMFHPHSTRGCGESLTVARGGYVKLNRWRFNIVTIAAKSLYVAFRSTNSLSYPSTNSWVSCLR